MRGINNDNTLGLCVGNCFVDYDWLSYNFNIICINKAITKIYKNKRHKRNYVCDKDVSFIVVDIGIKYYDYCYIRGLSLGGK